MPLCILVYSTGFAQKPLPRSYLQQKFIMSAFLNPQLKKGGLKITKEAQIDSVFQIWQEGWRKVSVDSLKNNPTKMNKEEFNNLDAYCYFWGMASLTQDLDFADKYGSILIEKYMVPSMHRDLEAIKRAKNVELIDRVDIANTFAIGSFPNLSKPAFSAAYELYKDYYNTYQNLAKETDTLVSKAAKKQIPTIEKMYYVMHARNSYYIGSLDQAFNYLITGLSVDRYSKSRAIDLAKKLNAEYLKAGEKDKAFTVLNTLAINTTPDNLNRDSLQSWYAAADPAIGPKIYLNLKSKLSSSAFKSGNLQAKLPASWTFLANEIPAENLKNVKYILVDFWYTGCGPCLEEIPQLNAFYEKIKARKDIILVSVNTDYENGKMDKTFVATRIKELGIKYPVFYDSSATTLNKQLGITGYPAKVILSSNGQSMVKTDNSAISLASFDEFLKENK